MKPTTDLVGVDTGGTFTDLVVWDGRSLTAHKVPSTPDDFGRGVMRGVQELLALTGGARAFELAHSATVATNALLERRGARTALITTAGFADVIEIGRQARPDLYDLNVERPAPLVPRRLRAQALERIDARGRVLQALDPRQVQRALRRLEAQGVQALAVVLLFSFLRPQHERQIGRLARRFGWAVSLSCDVAAEFREYERTATTVANAYVTPVMAGYLGRLERALRRAGCRSWRVVQSSGGSLSVAAARRQAVRTLLSGPAAGVCGAMHVARRALGGRRRRELELMTLDMGGTSTDVALIRGAPELTTEACVAGVPLRIPMLDIHTVGAGGGSLAVVDDGGALHVGPHSAGADPGPACYGRGHLATVTDANVVLGRIDPQRFLGGTMPLDEDRAQQALDRLAAQLGCSRDRAARAMVQVVEANMERALRLVSTQRGHDPRSFTLVCFGGAGGLHACALASSLGMQHVLVPREPGVLSALGALVSDVIQDVSRTVMWPGTRQGAARLERELARLRSSARRLLGKSAAGLRLESAVDLRYRGQSYEVTVAHQGNFQRTLTRFHAAHRRLYGHDDAAAAVEIVTARARAVVPGAPLRLRRVPAGGRTARPARVARRGAATVYDRCLLRFGNTLAGPALICEPFASTWVPAGWTVTVDSWGNLHGAPAERT